MGIETKADQVKDSDKAIVYFDIDNTLYSSSYGVEERMREQVHLYLRSALGLSDADATALRVSYYKTYGLVLRGLLLHHRVNPIEYDKRCNQAVPLEEMIKPDPVVRRLLMDLDRTKVKVWAFTNAYIDHAQRVLRIMGLEDLFDGIVYSDYAKCDFVVKPEPPCYKAAMVKAGVSDKAKCYFIDDSRKNIDAAHNLGWKNCVLFDERAASAADHDGSGPKVINKLDGLRTLWPEVFNRAAFHIV